MSTAHTSSGGFSALSVEIGQAKRARPPRGASPTIYATDCSVDWMAEGGTRFCKYRQSKSRRKGVVANSSFGRARQEVVTKRLIISQTGGTSECFPGFSFPVEQAQNVAARGPIRLVIGNSRGRDLLQGGKSG